MRRLIWVWVTFFAAAIMAACPLPTPTPNNPTSGQLPTLAGYQQHEGAELIDKLASNELLDAILLGRPELAVVASIIEQAGACAQEHGVVNWRAYVQEDNPAAAGVVVIASKNQATNPQVILQCSIEVVGARGRGQEGFSPCSDAYSYQAAGDTFYVFYGASKQSVCADFKQALPPAQ